MEHYQRLGAISTGFPPLKGPKKIPNKEAEFCYVVMV